MKPIFHTIEVLIEAPEAASEQQLEQAALAALVTWRHTPEGLFLPRVLASIDVPEEWHRPLARQRDGAAFYAELEACKELQRAHIKRLMRVPVLDDEPLAQALLSWSEDLLAWMEDSDARAPGCTEMGPILAYLHQGEVLSLAEVNFFDDEEHDHLVSAQSSYAETATEEHHDLWLVAICAVGAWVDA
ncbi:MAG: hypothetical protein H0X24_10825 [Ktedonobacterales bacterium]|nr:hypothetical protein [Ktedonobacterales bacterium]